MTRQMFSKGDLVTMRDGDGTVGFVLSSHPTDHAGERWYAVQFGASQENCRESDLRPHKNAPSLGELLATDVYGGPDAFRRHATAIKLKMHLSDTLYSYGASKTRLYPYQYVPLIKFLSSPYQRILIADEVGLGKTIEAGYILQEELARGRLSRVLIVCPASLRYKWQDELYTRFNHRFDILDASLARQRIPMDEREQAAANPIRAIVSLQSIRNIRFIDRIASSASPINLLIVDEAHHCRNSATLQSRAVSALIDQSDAVIFLSATPIQTSDLNLFTLLNMLVPEEFPSEAGFRQRLRLNGPLVAAETLLRQNGPEKIHEARKELESLRTMPDGQVITANPLYRAMIDALDDGGPDSAERRVDLQEQLSQLNLLSQIFTRTKRKDVHLTTAQRHPVIPEASLTDAEQEAYDALSNYIFEMYQQLHGDSAARLVLTTYQRQIASSIPASVSKFRDALHEGVKKWDDELESLESDELIDSSESGYSPLNDPRFSEILQGIDLAEIESHDTKYGLLIDTLRGQHGLADRGVRNSKKIMIFSYFRRSLDYLERRLSHDGFRFTRIDGSVKSTPDRPETDERQKRISRFREDPTVDIMLTSEVGSEGLDFQFCDTMVNWDLPWNPMVLEQRIGRLDRIGQKSPRIVIVNLACKGTIEYKILTRLYDRIGIFEHSIGELEPILGNIVGELKESLFRPNLTDEQRVRALYAREIAIGTQRKKQLELEQQAELLVGHDEQFRTKLDRIRRFGRYVGGDELRLFADNELRSVAPGLAFEQTLDKGVYQLAFRPEVEQVLDRELPRGDDEAVRFLTSYRSGRRRYAFDGESAEQYSDVEPLHARHPLIRALAQHLPEDLTENAQLASLGVRSRAVSPGPWFYLWALVVESGFLAAKSLLCSVVDVMNESLPVGNPDAGDLLLADMLRGGKPWPDFSPPSFTDAQACLNAAENEIRRRVQCLHERRTSRIEAIKSARRGTIEATYRMRIERQRSRLGDMEIRAQSEDGARRILPAVRSRLEHLEAERVVQIDRVDALKLGTVTYSLLGAGFVHVFKTDEPMPVE